MSIFYTQTISRSDKAWKNALSCEKWRVFSFLFCVQRFLGNCSLFWRGAEKAVPSVYHRHRQGASGRSWKIKDDHRQEWLRHRQVRNSQSDQSICCVPFASEVEDVEWRHVEATSRKNQLSFVTNQARNEKQDKFITKRSVICAYHCCKNVSSLIERPCECIVLMNYSLLQLSTLFLRRVAPFSFEVQLSELEIYFQ